MDLPVASPFRLGDWTVDPLRHVIARDGESVRLEPRTMRLLQCLAERAGAIVGTDELLDRVWPGVIVTPDSVYQAVAALRRLLGDDPRTPRYIVTVPKQGYRMIAPVQREPETDAAPVAVPEAPAPVAAAAPMPAPVARPAARRRRVLAAAALLLALGAGVGWQAWQRHASASVRAARSVAVLPFLDLTEHMGEEVFADGLTEALISDLGRVPGLHVPPPTAVYVYKDPALPLSQIAAQLGVAYVVDGSVRKSGAMLRVDARLVHADDGFVVWSRSYDRSLDDRLATQDDVAADLRASLLATLDGTAPPAPDTKSPPEISP